MAEGHDRDINLVDIDLMSEFNKFYVQRLLSDVDDYPDWEDVDKILVKLVILAALPV